MGPALAIWVLELTKLNLGQVSAPVTRHPNERDPQGTSQFGPYARPNPHASMYVNHSPGSDTYVAIESLGSN